METLIENQAINEGLCDILKESTKLMANTGFCGTSMRDLAKATGRSLSGLYHHFRSKEDLLYLMNWIFSWYSEEKYGSADQLADDCYLTFTQGLFGNRAALFELPGRDRIASRIRNIVAPNETETIAPLSRT
jgi:AcrR family transcriptional regulator